MQGALMLREAPTKVAEAFCAARLSGAGGLTFGTLPTGLDAAALMERAVAA